EVGAERRRVHLGVDPVAGARPLGGRNAAVPLVVADRLGRYAVLAGEVGWSQDDHRFETLPRFRQGRTAQGSTVLSTIRSRRMSQEIRGPIPAPCDLLALGEPTHLEPSFGWVRNELFARLAGLGFRSIALESDRVAALAVDDYVREGAGSLDAVMDAGFSHGFGKAEANRALVAWMHAYNRDRPAEERLAFHGFDVPAETTEAPSPRPYLEYARDYLGLDLDFAGLVGDDERWARTEAILD